jgi:hypothetical protein
MGFEPTTFCLASRRSTTELRPLVEWYLLCSTKLTKMAISVNTRAIGHLKDRAGIESTIQGKGDHKGSGRIPGRLQMFDQGQKILSNDKMLILMYAMIKGGYAQQNIGVGEQSG